MSARPLPTTSDPDSGEFFAAAARGELVVRVCSACAMVLHLPKAYCHRCRSWETTWRRLPGTGRVYAATVVRHGVLAAFPPPYTLLLVEPDGAPEARLVGHLSGTPAVAIGDPVEVWFETLSDGTVLPQWALLDDRPSTRRG